MNINLDVGSEINNLNILIQNYVTKISANDGDKMMIEENKEKEKESIHETNTLKNSIRTTEQKIRATIVFRHI